MITAVDGLHHSKSRSADRILNSFITSGKYKICPYLWILFNTIFMSGHFAKSWADGRIKEMFYLTTQSTHVIYGYRPMA